MRISPARPRRSVTSRRLGVGAIALATALSAAAAAPATAGGNGTLYSFATLSKNPPPNNPNPQSNNPGSHTFTPLGLPENFPQGCGGDHFLVKYGNYRYTNEFHTPSHGSVTISNGSATATYTVGVVAPLTVRVSTPVTVGGNGDPNWWYEGPYHNYPQGTTCATAEANKSQPISGFRLNVLGQSLDGSSSITCGEALGTYRRGWSQAAGKGNDVEFYFPNTTCTVVTPGKTVTGTTNITFNLALLTVDIPANPVTGTVQPFTICNSPVMPQECASVSRGPNHIKFG